MKLAMNSVSRSRRVNRHAAAMTASSWQWVTASSRRWAQRRCAPSAGRARSSSMSRRCSTSRRATGVFDVKVLVTGAAGFIGFHTAKRLLERGDAVLGFDDVNAYYSPELKERRLELLAEAARGTKAPWDFVRANLVDQKAVKRTFRQHRFDRVIHLAAQAGVRHSLTQPPAYIQSNITGFLNILEACRHNTTPHLPHASTPSVYGANTDMPFSEQSCVGHPLQLYAATKRANELMAHSYSHLFRLPTTGLRFFTVYGPWGRPDMALFVFTKAILDEMPIKVFNYGKHTRDFTYVDDVVEGVIRASDQVAAPNPDWSSDTPDPGTSNAPFRIFNIGNN